jgi:uncharacterized membrane protein YhhN
VCKPAAALAFLATAITLDPVHTDTQTWFCVALVFCVFGDMFLMLPRDAFVPGLASFLVAQLCFTVGFALHLASGVQLAVGIALVVVVAGLLTVRFLSALVREGRRSLVVPVVAYVAAIGAMVATAIGAGGGFAIAGAGLFFASDALIGETRFVRPRSWGPVVIIATYHLALTGLVFSLVRS